MTDKEIFINIQEVKRAETDAQLVLRMWPSNWKDGLDFEGR